MLYTKKNAWLDEMVTTDVSFTYDPFETSGSFKWTNYVEGESISLVQI